MVQKVLLKSRKELQGIYRSGQISAKLMNFLAHEVKPGISTLKLDELAEDFILKHNAKPAFKGYQNYPRTLCTSINSEVVHGIPRSDRILEDGDILKIDTGVVLDGFYSDTAMTFVVGDVEVDLKVRKLLDATREALFNGIRNARAGNSLNKVSDAVYSTIKRAGFKVIRELTGHGVGFALHEPPVVNNFPTREGASFIMKNGLVLAIEPMASVSCEEVVLRSDNWTYSTADGSIAAHFEHTVAILDGEPVVLTELENERAKDVFGF